MGMGLSTALKILKDEDGCFKGTAMAVCLVDACGNPVDITAIGGGGGADLEVVCDKVTGEQIFIKVTRDADGECLYTNPATGAVLVAGVDFCPCPDNSGELLEAINELIACMCGDCVDLEGLDVCSTEESEG